MNAKFVVAVLVALQVSLSLCDIPAPDPDVVVKYNDMKAKLGRRIERLLGRLQAAAAENPDAQAARDAIAGNARVGTAKEIMDGVAEEFKPLVDTARTSFLGFYSAYVRPMFGQQIQDGIDRIKLVLDQVAPADK